MMQIEVNTTTATLIPPRESLTPGMVNAVQIKFTFSDEWNGLEKTCVFSNELESVPAIIESDTVSVPTEVLDIVYRWISVGVTGEDSEGNVVIPTIWCRIGQCLPGVSGRFVTIDQLQAYWSKQEIDLHTDGDGSRFLGDDGQYHTVQDAGGDEKTFVAEYNVTTAQEIIAYLDAAKEPFAPMLVKRGADYYTVTTTAKQGENKVIIRTFGTFSGNYYMFTYTVTDGTWASSSYGFQPMLESGSNIKTIGGQSVLGSGDIPIQGLSQAQANWNETDNTSPAYIQNKPTIPDVSDLATKEELTAAVAPLATKDELTTATTGFATTSALTAGLALKADKTELTSYAKHYDMNQALATKADKTELQTLATKTELQDGLATKADSATLSNYALKTELPDTSQFATKSEVTQLENEKADKTEIITVTTGSGTLFLANDGTYKPAAGDPPDLSAYLTKTEAQGTYATQTALDDYETTSHASATYATKAELPDTSDMLTKTEAQGTYATQTALDDYETTAHADETYQKKEDASPIKTIAQQGYRIPVDEYGDAIIGYTAVSHVVTSGQKDLLTISQIVKSATTIAPSEKPTHFLQLFLDAAVDGVRKTGQIVFKSDNDSYEDVTINIVSKQWVEEYIASLDANNTTY